MWLSYLSLGALVLAAVLGTIEQIFRKPDGRFDDDEDRSNFRS
jgi:hypothetical protein